MSSSCPLEQLVSLHRKHEVAWLRGDPRGWRAPGIVVNIVRRLQESSCGPCEAGRLLCGLCFPKYEARKPKMKAHGRHPWALRCHPWALGHSGVCAQKNLRRPSNNRPMMSVMTIGKVV